VRQSFDQNVNGEKLRDVLLQPRQGVKGPEFDSTSAKGNGAELWYVSQRSRDKPIGGEWEKRGIRQDTRETRPTTAKGPAPGYQMDEGHHEGVDSPESSPESRSAFFTIRRVGGPTLSKQEILIAFWLTYLQLLTGIQGENIL